jgi:hypothetical protein
VVREHIGDACVCAGADQPRMGVDGCAKAEKKSKNISLDNEPGENVLPGSYVPFARIKPICRGGY